MELFAHAIISRTVDVNWYALTTKVKTYFKNKRQKWTNLIMQDNWVKNAAIVLGGCRVFCCSGCNFSHFS